MPVRAPQVDGRGISDRGWWPTKSTRAVAGGVQYRRPFATCYYGETRLARLLLACLEDESRRVRVAAAWALLGASPLPDEAVPLLMECLLSKSSEMRAWCCTLLGEIETNRQGVRVALELLAEHDPDEDVRWRAGVSLREIAEGEARVH